AVEDIERRVVEVLGRLGVPYEREPIDPDYADTGPYCERYGVPLAHAANTIIVASKKEPRQYAACVVKATTRLDVNHAVRRLMGASKLSFASAEETRAVTGTPAWKRRRRAHSVAPQPYIVLTSRPDSSTALWVGIVDFLAHR